MAPDAGDPRRESIRATWYAGADTRSGEAWTMLHLPYTMMVLGFVLVGAVLAPMLSWPVLAMTLAAYLLALGVGAHFLDQLPGMGSRYVRHWSTQALWSVGIAGLAGGVAIGLVGAYVLREPWLLGFVAVEGTCALGYSLGPIFRGVLHRDTVFIFSWGSLPCLTSYYAQAGSVSLAALIAAVAFAGVSLVEIRASRASRESRQRARAAASAVARREPPSTGGFRTPDRVLQLLAAGTTALSWGLLLGRTVLGG